MKNRTNVVMTIILCLIGLILASNFYVYAPDIGQVGGPIEGLTLLQLKKFYECREVFKKTFSVKDGLGPLYNADSCYACHGLPEIVGNQGSNPKTDSLTYIASPLQNALGKLPTIESIANQNSDFHTYDGGPIILIKSITKEFPNLFPKDCQIAPGKIPPSCTFISTRLAPALWGMGLIDAIGEEDLEDLELKESDNPEISGTSVSHRDSLTHQDRVGRFGYKDQFTSLTDAVTEQLNVAIGITTKYEKTIRTAGVNYDVPDCLKSHLPEEPNDNGSLLAKLNYFLALAAPPPTGKADTASNRGRLTFERLGCAGCHVPTLNTGSEYYLLDPASQFPTKRYLRIQALENREVRAYSDFLLHHMGHALADGIATSGGVTGGQWRTTPLWGLRYRKYFLHDGRTTDLSEAILAHGGQAQSAKDKFAVLSEKERVELLTFLKSL